MYMYLIYQAQQAYIPSEVIVYDSRWTISYFYTIQGRIQDFKLGGGALKKNRAKRREARKYLGYFVRKITILRKKNHIFSNFRGAGCAPLPESAPAIDFPWLIVIRAISVFDLSSTTSVHPIRGDCIRQSRDYIIFLYPRLPMVDHLMKCIFESLSYVVFTNYGRVSCLYKFDNTFFCIYKSDNTSSACYTHTILRRAIRLSCQFDNPHILFQLQQTEDERLQHGLVG